MLKPISPQMLKDTVILKICKNTDRWQNAEYDEIKLTRVHLQTVLSVAKSSDNTERRSSTKLFIDCKISTPKIDLLKAYNESLKNGAPPRIVAGEKDYSVQSIDAIPDMPATRIHHYEVTLT